MKILRWPGPNRDSGGRSALIFGLGVVGQAIDRALRRQTSARDVVLPFDWASAAQRAEAFGRIEAALGAGQDAGPPERIALIWAGGRSGFGSGLEELRAETALLGEVLEFGLHLSGSHSAAQVEVHMISSAGGLFEGIAPCGPDTLPRPLRPYGDGKLAQEALVGGAGFALARIYRLSSVYGFAPGGRVGLITALIGNALQARRTHIFGGLTTLRDYVLADDVGAFIARQVVAPGTTGLDTFLLASGRPVSMYEIIALVGRVIPSPLFLQFDPHPSNARDMSFLPSALPAGWTPAPLATGVVQVANRIRNGLC